MVWKDILDIFKQVVYDWVGLLFELEDGVLLVFYLWLLIGLIIVMVVLLVWFVIGQICEVVNMIGEILLVGQIFMVEYFEGGIVNDLFVEEG